MKLQFMREEPHVNYNRIMLSYILSQEKKKKKKKLLKRQL